MLYILLFPLYFLFMYGYFRIATKYDIIDRPNERSSHTEVTIRGGGVIFIFSAIIAGIMNPSYWMAIVGLLIIGTISFIDDRVTLSGKIRILFHMIAVTLLFYSLNLFFDFHWWIIMALYIVIIGIINAYNFMDGINGITGCYSLVVLSGLQYVNYFVVGFIDPSMIWLPIVATLVFLFFNFRKKARCFAGDVGSVSIAFWIIMLLLKLIVQTGNYSYILFLAVYGVDAVLTIIHRLYLKQNIFDAHRLHFYQILANERKIPHLVVSILYAIIQSLIILIIIWLKFNDVEFFAIILIPLIATYLLAKPNLMKNGRK